MKLWPFKMRAAAGESKRAISKAEDAYRAAETIYCSSSLKPEAKAPFARKPHSWRWKLCRIRPRPHLHVGQSHLRCWLSKWAIRGKYPAQITVATKEAVEDGLIFFKKRARKLQPGVSFQARNRRRRAEKCGFHSIELQMGHDFRGAQRQDFLCHYHLATPPRSRAQLNLHLDYDDDHTLARLACVDVVPEQFPEAMDYIVEQWCVFYRANVLSLREYAEYVKTPMAQGPSQLAGVGWRSRHQRGPATASAKPVIKLPATMGLASLDKGNGSNRRKASASPRPMKVLQLRKQSELSHRHR